ncbi:MAG: hypothetical protein H8D96_20610 [Desulfobacterales bacterium]|uniref:Leucine-binding protein domain-containing protein n=1 Tax=Candidatus Desulfatibia vada TaxID=2841696 RepID=A0A8J6TRQ0_9BACT|nr:hypothetical protein [Candidatus Desulfatibia vada]MBL6972091.1 hypothetical protein [Desulfobacterales bacterium]
MEGIIFSSTYNKESKHKNFVIFKKQFKERFGKIPDFSAVFSYEAAQLLFYGLSTTDEVEKLKDTIINRQIYPGLQGDIQIDKYGDVKRKRFLITVKDGQFITLE